MSIKKINDGVCTEINKKTESSKTIKYKSKKNMKG